MLSENRSVDLSLSAGPFSGPAGVTSLQVESRVESFFSMRLRVAFLILAAGASLAVVAGCHRSPTSDVVATVNGKEIMRAEMDRNYKGKVARAVAETPWR